jgi:hypothetical protein
MPQASAAASGRTPRSPPSFSSDCARSCASRAAARYRRT